MRRAVVLGAGGVLGLSWMIALLRRIEQEDGWDPRAATVLVGTSAGSVVAGQLAAGRSVEALLDRQLAASSTPLATPPAVAPTCRAAAPCLLLRPHRIGAMAALSGLLPRGVHDTEHLGAIIDRVLPGGGWPAHPATWIVATDLASGDRTVFGAPSAPLTSLREAVRASCSIPGWFQPTHVAGRDYVDGGVRSPTSADLLVGQPVDEVVILSALTGPPLRTTSFTTAVAAALRHAMTRTLDAEIHRLVAAGTRVIRHEPTADVLAVMGINPMDARRRADVLAATLATRA